MTTTAGILRARSGVPHRHWGTRRASPRLEAGRPPADVAPSPLRPRLPVHGSRREPPRAAARVPRIASGTPRSRTRTIAAMPAPRWFFRFMYDRESAAWERRRNEPEHRELVERTADELANVVASPGPVADLGCGTGAHALALARRGFDVVGVDGTPGMVEVARTR